METVIEGRWKQRGGARLHVAPEGMTLVDDTGGVVGTTPYTGVTAARAGKERRHAHLVVELRDGNLWRLDGMHPLQARFAAELIQDQLSALHRRTLASFSQQQPLARIPEIAASLLATSGRGVIDVLDFFLFQAVHHRVSDIHLEPFPSALRVRFRVDGILLEVAEIPALWLPRLLARLKILADLTIYRSDVPQEGRLAVRLDDRAVDVRVTLLPTLHGEKAVLRLFDPTRGVMRLEQLGMAAETHASWERLLEQPQGTLLLTGPSNHGKTTTLYASLAFLYENRRDLSNLCTVEDPVEYDLRVVNQTQVNHAAGLTFATGLRTVLRQDPEVIMIGEIRDEETAGIAVRAGLTGHLVLSTIHAPSAAGVFARLVDLGCEPFLVASSVSGVLAQRLVRMICGECRAAHQPPPALLARLGADGMPGPWSRGTGCSACGGTGYRGRTGVFQLLEVTDAIREGVLAGKSTGELERISGAAERLRADALAKAAAEITTLEEVERVLGSGR